MARAERWTLSHEQGLSLSTLDDSQKLQALELIRDASNRVEHIAALQLLMMASQPLIFSVSVAAPIILYPWLRNSTELGATIFAYLLLYAIAYLGFFIPAYLSLKLPFSRRSVMREPSYFFDQDPPGVFATWYMCMTVTLYAVLVARHSSNVGEADSEVSQLIVASLTSCLIAIALIFLVGIIGTLLRRNLEQTWLIRAPAGLMASGISSTIECLSQQWLPLESRAKAISSLEECAKGLEYGLPPRLRFNNSSLDSWFADEMASRAHAVREISKTISLAGKSSSPEVINRCSELLKCIVQDDWLSLPSVNLRHAEGTGPKTLPLQTRFRQILTAIIPAFIVFGAERIFTIESHALSYLWTGAAIWAFINILLALDPNAKEKLTPTREFADSLQNSKPDEKTK
jgi:hypothetical protein